MLVGKVLSTTYKASWNVVTSAALTSAQVFNLTDKVISAMSLRRASQLRGHQEPEILHSKVTYEHYKFRNENGISHFVIWFGMLDHFIVAASHTDKSSWFPNCIYGLASNGVRIWPRSRHV